MTPAQWLTQRLRGEWHKLGYGAAPCLAHEDKRPSLSIRDGETAPILKCHAGCSSSAIVNALRGRRLWPAPAEFCSREDNRSTDTSAWALEPWREARPIAGTIAELYLRSRGISGPLPPSLRYHRGLKHKATGLLLPAMVAGISGPDRHVIAIQRTFLKSDGSGKAQVSEPKMSLGAMGRGAVRLASAGKVLGIAEGTETGLSARQLFDVPVWCSLGAERLGKLELPREVLRVIVLGDIGSEAAAYTAREVYRSEGREAEVRFPTSGGKDFNDQLRAGMAA